MTSAAILEQRRALALVDALEDVYEDLAQRGLSTERIAATRDDPTVQPEYAVVIIATELARALVHERLAREALGRALGELYDRVEQLEASKSKEAAKK
jgi:hypothetical protein